jgi:hypothetical protein
MAVFALSAGKSTQTGIPGAKNASENTIGAEVQLPMNEQERKVRIQKAD